MPPPKPPDKPEALFPKLPPGSSRRSREETARHQRQRLMGAMVEAVAQHGLPATTVRELVALAGVSSRAFYQHFELLEDCFLATVDQIVERASEQVGGLPLETRLRRGHGGGV